MPSKAVIFDYGGVVSAGGVAHELPARLAIKLHISVDSAAAFILEPWTEFMTGRINESQYWNRIEKLYGKSIPIEKRLIWNSWEDMAPRPRILDLIKELRQSNYIVGLLSNVIPSTASIIRRHGGYGLFQPCILSCEVGFAKPDVRIYEKLLHELPGIIPEEILFIDDQDKCLVPAMSLGMKTLFAEGENEIVSDIKKALKI